MSKLITEWELQQFKDKELCALFRKVSQELTQSKPGTCKRRNALASMENISRALNHRVYHPKPPRF